ncbi:hypothetical protein [Paraclostridium tenue]|uniref:TIGR04255 family protein n=1 Tax=Paraclostridium tenue TaxID=1737 RepID=A0ABN1M5I1_9FIRM
MKIDNIGFNLYMPKVDNIRRFAYDIEQELKEYFITPFNIIPIPDDAPEEIPRIIAKSQNGHSELSISSININLNIEFDDIYNRDIDRCFDYIKERISKLIDVFSKYSDGKFLFSGIISRVIIDDIEDPIGFLSNNFLNVKSNNKLYNMSEKMAYLLDDTYYLNFNIYNIRTFEGVISENKVKPDVKEISHYMSIDIDMNDKYGYNHNEDHICTKDTIDHIIKSIKYNINQNINNIIEKKELILSE